MKKYRKERIKKDRKRKEKKRKEKKAASSVFICDFRRATITQFSWTIDLLFSSSAKIPSVILSQVIMSKSKTDRNKILKAKIKFTSKNGKITESSKTCQLC